jgi:hypothetical protein
MKEKGKGKKLSFDEAAEIAGGADVLLDLVMRKKIEPQSAYKSSCGLQFVEDDIEQMLDPKVKDDGKT